MTAQRPIRILHLTGGLNRAGAETWLMHVLRNIDRQRFQFDFVVSENCPYDYEAEAVQLGARVIRCRWPAAPWTYIRDFKRILRDYGPYDVVHSHVHYFSGLALRAAHAQGVPMRIAHSHCDTRSEDERAGVLRKIYLRTARRNIREHATLGLAVSKDSGQCLFDNPRSFPVLALNYSLDFAAFRCEYDGALIRGSLGIPEDAVVIGHAGRFADQKNHDFLVRVFEQFSRMEPKAWLLLAGRGELRRLIESRLEAAGLLERTTFAGVSQSVASLMAGAMDVFVFPSFYEGLGLVLIEAQAAGLPCVLSDRIPVEVDVIPKLMNRLSLNSEPKLWAKRALSVIGDATLPSRTESLNIIEQSEFGSKRPLSKLERLYAEAGNQ